MAKSGIYRKIGSASLIMMTSIFLSRFMGLFREMTIAAVGGADMAVDAYRVAFVLPEILNHVLASGFLSVTFIPILADYLTKNDEEGAWHIFSIILTIFGSFLILLITIAIIFAPQLVAIMTPGRNDPTFQAMAVRMTRIILPAQFFFFCGSLFMAVQFVRERFSIPALAPLFYNLGIIICGLILGPVIGMEGFCWGVLAGAFFGSFIIQWYGSYKSGLKLHICFDLLHPDLKRYVLLTLPLMLGLTMTFSTEIFSKFFGSFLPEGAISWVDYAMRVMLMLVAFFGQAVGVASYPFLAKLAAERRMEELNQVLNNTMRYLALVIPISMLFIVLRREIVIILFQRGNFTPLDSAMTASVLGTLLIGAVAFAAQTVVNRGFYATENTLFPAVFGTISVVLSLPIYWFGITLFGAVGLGMAIAFSAILQVLLLFYLWNRKSANHDSGQVYTFYLKVILVTLPLGAVLYGAHFLMELTVASNSFTAAIVTSLVIGICFFIMAAMAAKIFHIREVLNLWKKIYRKIKR
ncbi:MAG: murein biosynthesis integral membrane protein MurJ [Desulfobacteraceae bacterium]|jgi:putative peptidoglycan lipid II flippase